MDEQTGNEPAVVPEAPEGAAAVEHAVERTSPTPTRTERLLALDIFRGVTITLMLLVNNVALDTATPSQLMHAPWNAGVRVADLVFPWFLFAVGVAIPFSVASAKRKGLLTWRLDLKIVGRAAALVALGCLIDSTLQHRLVFTLGVLQIIGLAYLVAALLYDLPISRRLLIAAGMLVGYWAFIRFVPVPNAGPGVFDETRNIIYHLNRTYFNAVSLWGVPSVVPTEALVLLSTIIGDVLRRPSLRPYTRLAVLFLSGVALAGLGALWNLDLPFNKPLWTPAYVLLAIGLGTIVLALLYLVADLVGWSRVWSYPFLVFGSNAIVAYVAPILVKVTILQGWRHTAHGVSTTLEQWLLTSAKTRYGPIGGGWLYTLGYLGVWWVVLWLLYRKRVFLRV